MPTGIRAVATGARGFTLRKIIRVFHISLSSGAGVAYREVLPPNEPAIVVSNRLTMVYVECRFCYSRDYGACNKVLWLYMKGHVKGDAATL